MLWFGIVLIFIFLLNRFVPTSFIPQEDQGFFTVELEMPEGATIERMREVTEKATHFIDGHIAVDHVQNTTGSSQRVGTNQGRTTMTVILKPWKERSVGVDEVIKDIRDEFYHYPEIKVYAGRPPVVPGLGEAGGIEMKLQARSEASWDELVAATDTFMRYASLNRKLGNVSASLQPEIPQLYFNLDRDKAMALGVPVSEIFATMKAYLGAVYVNDFNMFNRVYKVYIQADQGFRMSGDDLNLFFVRASNGTMVPLASLGSLEYTTGPGNISRFNMYTSASIQVTPAAGYSSGEAMNEIQKIVNERLPENIGLSWSGLSFQEQKAQGGIFIVLALVFLFAFLFLAALYESWSIPVAVILSFPVATLGAFLGIWAVGLNNDIFFQIGLVTLIGLAAKNAILIVEFAKVQVDKGVDPVNAAINAARLRFRPIVMTSLAFILGLVPLVFASGPGSASRHSIGTGVFFGMIFATVLGIIAVPFFFVLLYKLKNKVSLPSWCKFPPLKSKIKALYYKVKK